MYLYKNMKYTTRVTKSLHKYLKKKLNRVEILGVGWIWNYLWHCKLVYRSMVKYIHEFQNIAWRHLVIEYTFNIFISNYVINKRKGRVDFFVLKMITIKKFWQWKKRIMLIMNISFEIPTYELSRTFCDL